jgi:4-aminobutyrate aminotransferase-like enzyme
MEAPQVGGLGGTYGGNPLACAAALAVLDAMEAERIPAHAQRTGDRIKARFHQWAAQFPCIGDIRGLGAMVGMELSPTARHARQGAHRPRPRCRAERAWCSCRGTFGNHPGAGPLTTDDAVIDEASTMGAALEGRRSGPGAA